MRKFAAHLLIFSWAVLFGAHVLATEQGRDINSGTGPQQQSKPAISKIAFRFVDDRVAIDITSTGSVDVQAQTLSKPERLVFDFPGCDLKAGSQRLNVGHGVVIAVRASVFQVDPLVTRIVIDLRETRNYEIQRSGETLSITLANGIPAAPVPTKADLPLAKVNAPAGDLNVPTAIPDARPQKKTDSAILLPQGHHAVKATLQQHAYGLLDKAKRLTVADLQPLENRAATADPEAETMLALAYHAGVLLKHDDEQALDLLYKAADRHFLAAEEALGIFCQLGIGKPESPEEALEWYTKAANQGSTDAATNIGLMYAAGNGVDKDLVRAVSWFRRAAEREDATAELNLAAMYERGDGVPRDPKKSLEWLTKAAEQDLIPAILKLAKMNLQPAQAPTDINAAIQWYERAATLGDGFAEAALGEIYAEGIGVKADYEKALSWYRQSAEQGQRDGEFGLGALYWQGHGVSADPEQARGWFEKAANHGHANAQYDLGMIYEHGRGAPTDTDLALTYYEMAADQGVPEAQYRLGSLLAKQEGSRLDKIRAYKWLSLAKEKLDGSGAAADLRESMTPADIAAAEKEISAWRAKHMNHGIMR